MSDKFTQGAEDKLTMIRAYRSQVEKELRDICSDILGVLDKHLIPSSQTGESKVFYYKMKVSSNLLSNRVLSSWADELKTPAELVS